MNNHQLMVKQFMKAVGQDMPDRPTQPTNDVAELRTALIYEEAREFSYALRQNDFPGVVDAIADLLYVTYGAAVAFGIDIEPIFFAVHQANMTKFGGPVREDGKQLKPKDWKPADIQYHIAAQERGARLRVKGEWPDA